jgi:flagellar hook protein FlgE
MFDTAISGLQAASTDLNVVSNNLANASSTGFKSSRALFSDMYAGLGGSSANAVGIGVQLAAVNQQFTQGAFSITNNSMDMAIDGEGFFGLSDGGAMVYSRAGAFGTDKDGFIVNSAGQRLTGYLADAQGAVTAQLGDLRIDVANMQPAATAQVRASMNLDAGSEVLDPDPWPGAFAFGDPAPDPTTYTSSTSLSIYDSLGNPHTLSLYMVNRGGNTWDVHTLVDGVTVGSTPAMTLEFGEDGLILDPAAAQLDIAGWLPLDADGVRNGAAEGSFSLSLLDSTQFGSPFSVHALSQDGYATGQLSRISVDNTGTIYSYFTNGQAKALGQVALYNFANADGLAALGDSAWAETASSGAALVGAPGSGSLGAVMAGSLEQSNVDITAELVHLILAQRNYQANAQTIRAADTVTQTIINLR